ncbi:hypothetical protein RB195_022774 [Necator americanus]|uniref:Uncharacterized protein n=1 Tax=Necator americanus TaxID=51031 RepID=A0ABR1EGK5_NECAM
MYVALFGKVGVWFRLRRRCGPKNHLNNSSKDTTAGDQKGRKLSRSPIRDQEEGGRKRRVNESKALKMPRRTEVKASELQFENFLAAMVEQMRIQHEEMKTLLTAMASTQRTAVWSDKEVGHTSADW